MAEHVFKQDEWGLLELGEGSPADCPSLICSSGKSSAKASCRMFQGLVMLLSTCNGVFTSCLTLVALQFFFFFVG